MFLLRNNEDKKTQTIKGYENDRKKVS